ncbi:MAG TPA: LEA type 2 family protein [Polyangiaceae bacterium]|nr:LEA type 2 family protein [Polyangiaceae bacterium]
MNALVTRCGALIALAALLVLCACSKPKAPTLTPQRVDTISSGAGGLVVRVTCKAHNPNAIPLPARKAEGNITLGGTPLGTFNATALPTLPANSDTDVSFDLTVPWLSLASALVAATGTTEIPYVVRGDVEFEAAGIKLATPFTMKSTVQRTELAIAFLRFLPPNMRPKLNLPATP